MAILTVYDDADEYRIEITGNFVGSAVHETDQNWRKALADKIHRKITIDISQLSNYDNAGYRLLRKMHQHGTTIAAATPRSLIFLQEITALPRRGPALVQQAVNSKKPEAQRVPNTKSATAGQ